MHPVIGEINSSSAGYIAGYWAGYIGAFAALMAGIIKCGFIAARPSASAKAMWSLIILLSVWAVLIIVGRVQQFGPGRGPIFLIAYGGLALLVIASLVTSVVLAILGLVDCTRHKDVYKQGKRQAISSLIISGLILFFGIASFVSKAIRPTVASSSRSLPVTFTNLNFTLVPPGRPWGDWKVQKIIPKSTFGMMRTAPGMFFAIIAEVVGSGASLSPENYGEIVRSGISGRAESVRPLGERHITRKGLDGLEMETQATLSGNNVDYFHWLVVTNGYAYQLVVWGDQKDQNLIRKEADHIFSGFSLLDGRRVAGSLRKPLEYRSPANHFELTLPSGWFESSTKEKNFPNADFMASHIQGVPFAIVALDLRGEEITDDALINVMLGCMNFKYPSGEIVGESRTAHEWGMIFRFECQRSPTPTGGEYDYSLFLLRRAQYAYLMAAWNSTSLTNAPSIRQEAFYSFRPLPVPDMPEPTSRLSASQRRAQGNFWNELGLIYYSQNQFEKGSHFFALAGEHSPENSVYLANQIDSLANLGKQDEALEIVEKRLPSIDDPSGALRARKAALEEKVGRSEQAAQTYAALFQTGYRSDSSFATYLELLAEQNKLEQALLEADRYLTKGDSVTVRLSQASLLRRKNEFGKSIELLKAAQSRWPGNPQINLSLAESLVQSGSNKEAADLVQQLLGTGYNSAGAYYLKGRAEIGLKAYRDAKASFEKAREKAPTSSEIQVFLARVSGILGEGSNTEIKEPITPVAIPKEILEPRRTADNGTPPSDHGARYLKRVVAHSFAPGQSFKTTEYQLIQVHDRSGVSDLSTLQFSFDPFQESIYVNSLKVKDANGGIQATGKVSDYYTLDDSTSRTVSQRKILNIPVPSLQLGSQIELILTRQISGSVSNFPYREHFFSMASPVVESTLLVLGDLEKVRFTSSASLQPNKVKGGLYWQISNPPVFRWEPLQPPPSEYLPFVRLTDARTSWEQEALSYRALIHDRFNPSDSLGQLASNLVGRLTSSDAKIAVLSRYVQSNITYKPIEFGRRALIPQIASDTLANRYGDCKDHSLLLVQLADAAHVPASLALVNSRHPIDKELPSLDQFDHMIVYVPGIGQGTFIDSTDKGSDLSQGIPFGLAGKEALIVEEKGSRYVSIAALKATASQIYSERTIRLTNSSDLAVAETLKISGAMGAALRSWFRDIEPPARIRAFQSQLATEADINTFDIGDLDRLDRPLELRLSYSLRRQLQGFDNRFVGQLPCVFERAYIALAPQSSRSTPVQLTIPVTFETHLKFMVPDGYSLSPLKTPEKPIQERFAICHNSVRSESNYLELEWKIERQIGTFPASEYGTLKSTLDNAIDALARTLVLTKTAVGLADPKRVAVSPSK